MLDSPRHTGEVSGEVSGELYGNALYFVAVLFPTFSANPALTKFVNCRLAERSVRENRS